VVVIGKKGEREGTRERSQYLAQRRTHQKLHVRNKTVREGSVQSESRKVQRMNCRAIPQKKVHSKKGGGQEGRQTKTAMQNVLVKLCDYVTARKKKHKKKQKKEKKKRKKKNKNTTTQPKKNKKKESMREKHKGRVSWLEKCPMTIARSNPFPQKGD